MNIIIDDRERKIIELINNYKDKIKYKIERINIGDIALCYNDKIICIIERKTWNDLSSSIRDGRKDNVNKLLFLRNKIGCKIFYFIEGNIDPKPNSRFNRIAYKNLRSHLDHLIFRDDIHIIHIKSTELLIERIIEMMNNYITIKEFSFKNIDENNKNVLSNLDNFENNNLINLDNNNENENNNLDNLDNFENNNLNNLDNEYNQTNKYKINNFNDDDFLLLNLINENKIEEKSEETINNKLDLKIKINKTININKNILQSFKNINFILLKKIDNEKYTFISLYNTDNFTLLENIIYNGKTIKEKSIKIIKEIKSIIKPTKNAKQLQIKLLSCIPTISKKSAEFILNNLNFIDLINNKISIETLSNIYKSDKIKIGEKAAKLIIDHFSIK